MESVTAPALKRPGTVSYTLVLRHSARRIAHKLHLQSGPIEQAAVDAYRETNNPHNGRRVLHAAAATQTHRAGGDA